MVRRLLCYLGEYTSQAFVVHKKCDVFYLLACRAFEL